MKIGLLVSGNLGYKILLHVSKKYNLSFILTDSNSDIIMSFAKKQNIPLFVGNPRNGLAYSFIKNYTVDVIASVNYLYLIEKDIIKHPNKLIFNIHGSLLPKYRGRTPHVWAIINGEKETGITAHLLDEGCDTGDIIEQVKIKIGENDSGADILEKFNHLYIPLFDSVLTKIQKGNITYTKQDESKATYFGKRTPSDGKISWDWNAERIRNWVRAQRKPYPGAFTYLNDKKIVIDSVTITDIGFNYATPNGFVVKREKTIYVKTPDKMVCLNDIRQNECLIENGVVLK